MKNKLLVISLNLVLGLILANSTNAQSPCPYPSGCVTISQDAANRAAQLAREAPIKDEQIKVRDAALSDKDKIIAEIKAVAAKNEADLKAALHKAELEYALKTGQLIGAEASNVRNLAVIDVLLKHVRPKKIGILVF